MYIQVNTVTSAERDVVHQAREYTYTLLSLKPFTPPFSVLHYNPPPLILLQVLSDSTLLIIV